jgi:hypothetical protein
MNKIWVEANPPGLKLHCRLSKFLCPDTGNSEIDGKSIQMEAAFCHMPSEASQVFVVFRRPVTRDNVDHLATGKAVFYLPEEVDYLDADWLYYVCIVTPEEVIDTMYLLLNIVTACPVTRMEPFSGMDIVKFQDPFLGIFKTRGSKDIA